MEGVVTIDKDSRIRTFNDSAESMFGYVAEEVVGQPVSVLMLDRDGAKHDGFVLDYLRTGEGKILGVKARELVAKRKDGTAFPIELHVSEYFLGEERRFVGSMRDISERVERERTIQESEQRFVKVFQANPGLVAISDIEDGRHIDVNETWLSTLGYERDEVIGKTAVELGIWADMKYRRAIVDELKKDGSIRSFQGKLCTKSGEVRDFLIDGEIIELDQKPRLLLAAHDITERMKVEDDLRRALVEAEQANHAKSEFMATMSHELRTPLNAIMGFSEMLAGQYFGALGSEKYTDYAEDIKASSEHLLHLVNDILDLSAIEAGERYLSKEYLRVMDVVGDCAPIIVEMAKRKDIDCSFDIAKNLPLLHADRRALKQVLLNVLSNAVKFSPELSSVTLTAVRAENHHVIEICDTGIGIENDRIDSLTEPFSRHEPNPLRPQDGVGLGLAIVKSLIDLHQGELLIESEMGVGTKVTMRFPSG